MSIAGRDNSLVSNDFGNQIPIVKRLKTRRKSALFLSIEMICIMIVIAIIIVAVAASTKYLYELYEIQTISKEFTMYREAFKKFKAVYNYDAGMVPDAYLVGDINMSSITDTTLNMTQTGAESFRQLAIAGLIPKNLVNVLARIENHTHVADPIGSSTNILKYTYTCAFGNYPTTAQQILSWQKVKTNIYGVILPKSQWNSEFHYNATISSVLYKPTTVTIQKAAIDLGMQTGVYRMMALLYHNYSYGWSGNCSCNANISLNRLDISGCDPNITTTCWNIDTVPHAASISASMMSKIDSKIDDGHPATGWVMAERIYGYFTNPYPPASMPINGCYTPTTTPTTVAQIKAITYLNDSKWSPTYSCIPFIDISTGGNG